MLAVLSAIAIVFFFLTSLTVKSYHAKEKQLGKEWAEKGHALLRASEPSRAVEAFQTSLRYEPDTEDARYAMVDSLLAAGRSEQARSYLLSLWERQPANGIINLDLARIAAQRNDVSAATRYYHNAIYGVWQSSPQQQRTQARLELIRFLLQHNAQREADAELVALAANVPASPGVARILGPLFLRSNDPDNAAEQYRVILQSSPRDPEALGGAGKADFALGRYASARDSLQRAKTRGNPDPEVEQLLQLSELILQSDPLDQRQPWAERAQRLIKALTAASARTEACAAQLAAAQGSAPADLEQMLQALEAAQNKSSIRSLSHDPDQLINSAALAFAAEEATAKVCGQPAGLDLALLLIGRSRPEVRR